MDIKKIEDLHLSNCYGIIIECGCAATIANTLMSVEGSSNTIYAAIQPYSKEYQNFLFPETKNSRSVSYEFVQKIIKKNFEIRNKFSNKLNFILVSSFQLHNKKTNNLTHGWIGLKTEKIEKYYHISIYKSKCRAHLLDIIAELSIELLHDHFVKENTFSSSFVDQIIDIADTSFENTIKETLKCFEKINTENFLFINGKDKKIERLEDFYRGYEGIILQKGSYNPIHEGHITMFTETVNTFPTYNSAFFISTKRWDKPNLTTEELFEKIIKIISLGYNVVICKQEYFSHNIASLRERYNGQIIFPVGIDTINRVCDDITSKIETIPFYYDEHVQIEFKNVKFFVFKRKEQIASKNIERFKYMIINNTTYIDSGVSSTKIRNGEWESKT